MSPRPTATEVARWWQILDDHRQRHGTCPICRTPRRCRVRAEAFGQLVAHDLYLSGPPRPTTGRNQRPAAYAHQGAKMDLTGATWFKSSKSGPNCDNCVEVAYVPGAVGVRDSKDAGGPALVFAPADWQAFVAGARRGGLRPA